MAYDKTNDFQDIQADVLGTDTSTNTKLSKLKQLKTENKVPTKAINALNDQLSNAQASASDALQRVVSVETAIRNGEVAVGGGSGGSTNLTQLLQALCKDVLAWTGYARGTKEIVFENGVFELEQGLNPVEYLPTRIVNVTFMNAAPEESVNIYWDVRAVNTDETGDYVVTALFEHGYFSSVATPHVTLRVVAAPVLPMTYGMVLLEEGGGAGTWVRVNNKFETVDFDASAHGTWAGMHPVTVDGQDMIEIPVTWVKTEVLQSGPYTGKTCWWIAEDELDGYHVHPAFLNTSGHAVPLRVGAWIASKGENNVPQSVEKGTNANEYWPSLKYTDVPTAVTARNAAGATTGWASYDLYTHSLLQRMMLVEFGTPDTHTQTLDGTPWDGSGRVVYHGIHDPFGIPKIGTYNITFWISGIQTANSKWSIAANDGSGTTVNTGLTCFAQDSNGKKYHPVTTRLDKGTGYDFGDLFITATDNNVAENGSFACTQLWNANTAFIATFTVDANTNIICMQSMGTGNWSSGNSMRLIQRAEG